ncbi:MAG: FtsX-like permease family protein [Bacillota bacterium]|nr:FtsX-like permease family protein [Bacillota bacterium]
MWSLIRSGLLQRKMFSALIIISLSIASGFFLMTMLTNITLAKGLALSNARLGADILILPSTVGAPAEQMLFSGIPMNIYMEEKVFLEIKDTRGVAQATPQFFSQTVNDSCCSIGGEYRLVGFDVDSDFMLKAWMDQHLGRELQEGEVILGAAVPAFLGDRALILDKLFTVVGQLGETGTGMDKTIFTSLKEARALTEGNERLGNTWGPQRFSGVADLSQMISAVLVKVEDRSMLEQVVIDIEEKVNAQVIPIANVLNQTKEQLDLISTSLYLGLFLLGIICWWTLFSHFNWSVNRRKSQLGLFKAVGAKPQQLFLLIALEAVVLGIVGGAIGLMIGGGLFWVVTNWLANYTFFPWSMPAIREVIVIAVGYLICIVLFAVIASFYPAIRVAKIDPSTAISQGKLE